MKEDKIEVCCVDGCGNKVESNGLCSKHYNKYIRSGDMAGVYKINLDDEFYIGMSYLGIDARIKTEKSRLRTNNPQSVCRKLLEHFNELCSKEPDLTREEVLDKHFKWEVIECSPRWCKIDENFNGNGFKDYIEQRELTFKANISTNEEVVAWIKQANIYWKARESKWIKHYKDLDAQNGTNYCLNIMN